MGSVKRRRVSRDHVRTNASRSGGASDWWKLPKDVRCWSPEKTGTYVINVWPYEVSVDDHPDRVERGVLWYKRPFRVHFNIGVNNETAVCPTSIGKNCPVCEAKARLAKNYEENQEQVKQLTARQFVAYNITDPDNADRIALYVTSKGKFPDVLDQELREGPDELLNFYDVTKDGRSMKVRFSEETWEGGKFLQATRIDFSPRAAMDEDEILQATVKLDEALVVPTYEQLKKAFLQLDASDGDEDGGDDESPKRKTGRFNTGKSADADADDDEAPPKKKAAAAVKDDDDGDDPEPDDDEPPKKKTTKVSKDDDGDDPEPDADDDEAPPKKKAAAKSEPDDSDPEPDDDEPPKKTTKAAKSAKPAKDDDDDDPEPDDDEPPKKSGKGGGRFGGRR